MPASLLIKRVSNTWSNSHYMLWRNSRYLKNKKNILTNACLASLFTRRRWEIRLHLKERCFVFANRNASAMRCQIWRLDILFIKCAKLELEEKKLILNQNRVLSDCVLSLGAHPMRGGCSILTYNIHVLIEY